MHVVLYKNHETWLICGGRDFSDEETFRDAMNEIMGRFGCPSKIVHGAARGADSMADALGRHLALEVIACPADWQKHGKAAGPIRNREMLDYKPHKVIAFPGGRGTQNMVTQARKADIDVIEVQVQQRGH